MPLLDASTYCYPLELFADILKLGDHYRLGSERLDRQQRWHNALAGITVPLPQTKSRTSLAVVQGTFNPA